MSPPSKKRLILAVKLLIFLTVVAGIAYTVRNSIDELKAEQRDGEILFDASNLSFAWLLAAGGAYLLALVPSWIYWHQVLHAMGQRPTYWEAFRAYYMSHLGKYVPGKAMVVVLRTGSIRSDRVDTTVAATSVFVETLTLMAVGALISSGMIAVLYRDQIGLVLLGLGLMLAAGVPTLPPLFRRIVKMLPLKWANPKLDESLAGLNYRLMLSGWLLGSLSWFMFGVSLWATLNAVPGENPPLTELPFLIACIAISTVAGFLSMIPGGLGVRELVMIPLMQANPSFTTVAAIASAVLIRLVWLLSEVSVLIMLYVGGRLRKPREEQALHADPLPKGEGPEP